MGIIINIDCKRKHLKKVKNKNHGVEQGEHIGKTVQVISCSKSSKSLYINLDERKIEAEVQDCNFNEIEVGDKVMIVGIKMNRYQVKKVRNANKMAMKKGRWLWAA